LAKLGIADTHGLTYESYLVSERLCT